MQPEGYVRVGRGLRKLGSKGGLLSLFRKPSGDLVALAAQRSVLVRLDRVASAEPYTGSQSAVDALLRLFQSILRRARRQDLATRQVPDWT